MPFQGKCNVCSCVTSTQRNLTDEHWRFTVIDDYFAGFRGTIAQNTVSDSFSSENDRNFVKQPCIQKGKAPDSSEPNRVPSESVRLCLIYRPCSRKVSNY